MSGGMEAVYVDMVNDIGFLRFAPVQTARGKMFSARGRAQQPGNSAAGPVTEQEFYSEKHGETTSQGPTGDT